MFGFDRINFLNEWYSNSEFKRKDTGGPLTPQVSYNGLELSMDFS